MISICFNLTLDVFNFGLLLPDEYFKDLSLSRSPLSLSLSRSLRPLSLSRSLSRSLRSRSLSLSRTDDELLTLSLVDELFDELDFEFGEIAADFRADILGFPLLLLELKCFGDDVPY